MGNVRALPNKMDELTTLTHHQRDYHECSIMVLTETWLRKPDFQAVGDQTWVNNLNLFFSGFDQTPTRPTAQSSLLPP